MSAQITKKLFLIRNEIQKQDKVKPAGWNDFHKYWYYTPSQIIDITNNRLLDHQILLEFNITDFKSFPSKTSTTKTETREGISITTKTEADTFDFIAVVDVIVSDVESGEQNIVKLNVPMDKFSPQGYGGILTYVQRYYFSKTFGISSDDPDADSQEQNKKKDRPKC